MITSISIEAIEKQLLQQLSSFFFLSEEDEMLINIKMGGVISRCEYCFSRTKNKYYSCDGETYFNPIFLLTPFLKILITVYWQISCII